MYRVPTRYRFLLFVTFSPLSISLAAGDSPGTRNHYVVCRVLKSIDTTAINHDLKVGLPTVDVAIYLGETDEKSHG